MTALSEQQLAEAVEAMARTFNPRTSESGAHTFSIASSDSTGGAWKADLAAALTAALPIIERAVLERAATSIEEGIAGARKIGGPFALIEIRTRQEAATDVRALADEVKG